MRLLLTRPLTDDDPLPELLRAHGHVVTQDPLLRIEPVQLPAMDVEAFQAVVITSSNAVRALAATALLARLQGLPVFAVGQATATAARQYGFADVRSGPGTAAELVPAIAAALNPLAGDILYLRGKEIAHDTAAALQACGFCITAEIAYRAVASRNLAAETVAGILRGAIDGAVLMSPRTAEVYVGLAELAGLQRELAFITHYCLSDRVAAPLRDLPDLPVRIPPRPELQELVALIDLDATQS